MSSKASILTSLGLAASAWLASAAFADVPPPKAVSPNDDDAPAQQAEGSTAPSLPTSDGTAAPATPTPEQTAPPVSAEESKEEALIKSLVKRDGVIALPGGQGVVTVADGFVFLDAADAQKLLTQIWHNPLSAVDNAIGLIMPRDVSPTDEKSWAAIISYDNDGHVSDSDASSINYDDLLKTMQSDIEGANEQRQKEGYEAISLVGWAQKPSYNAAEHKLFWAKHLRFGTNDDTLNYAIRALGRTGVLQINVVAGMNQLPDINAQVPKLMSMVSFAQGHRYADFNANTDQVAAYGLAALVAGGVAAKAGLFKGLLALLAASWKIVGVAVIAVGATIARVFRGLFGRKTPPAS